MKVFFLIGILTSALLFVVAANNSQNGKNQEGIQKIVQDAIKEATSQYEDMMRKATINGAQSQRRTREAIKSTKTTQEIGKISTIYRNAFKNLTSRSQVDQKLVLQLLKDALPQQCRGNTLECDAQSKYRTVDGTCNNLENSNWGSTNMPSVRLLPPAYEGDGTDDPRVTDLPPARQVSLAVHIGDGDTYELNVTHMAAQFGQFLDHDITLTPVEGLPCCGNPTPSDQCMTIPIKADDPHYGTHNVVCLDFVRSTRGCSEDIVHREQFNAITAYIDGSVVYGSDETLFSTLRGEFRGGKLAENSEMAGFLPWRSDVIPGDNSKTVIGGDVRANEMPGLTVLQSLFLREHNRIATEFGKLRPDWNDEKIFQETRRIIAAELQQITYDQFLPSILGQQAMKDYELELPADHSKHTTYNDKIDATIFNSFATAAYRFGHTLVNGLIKLYMDKDIVSQYNVRDNYLIPDRITNENHQGLSGYDLILNGLIRQHSQAYDGEIHTDMTNHLFKTAEFVGSDLAARNIQRGRDHGLPSYHAFRQYCNLQDLTENWAEDGRPADISQTAWNKLRLAGYTSPRDVDLYTAGLSEIPVPGSLSGPTFVCLQGTLFQRLMKGDRFFFTHSDVSGAFSTEQLVALRGRTLGDIICENSALKEAPHNVFYVESQLNPMMSCESDSRKLNVKLFAELGSSDENTTEKDSATTNLATFTTLFISLIFTFTVGRVIPRIL